MITQTAKVAGVFEEDSSLMSQLSLLKTKKLAQKWWAEYLAYHNGEDQGVSYVIGYFADRTHSDNLRRWFK